MSDNDSVKRGEAKAVLGQLTLYRAQIEGDNAFVVRYTEAYEALNGIPAVPQEMSARVALFTRRLNDIIDGLQEQADKYNQRANELLSEEDGQVSQYTWAVSLRETHRRTIRTLEDLLCEAEQL